MTPASNMSFADFYRGPYNLKALADYDTGEATAISAKQAAAASRVIRGQ